METVTEELQCVKFVALMSYIYLNIARGPDESYLKIDRIQLH